MFAEETAIEDIGRAEATPLILIEAKPVDADLTEAPDQLAGYVNAEPAIDYGAGVVTDGRRWMLYDLSVEGEISGKHVDTVNIIEGAVGKNAKTLHYWLSKERWR